MNMHNGNGIHYGGISNYYNSNGEYVGNSINTGPVSTFYDSRGNCIGNSLNYDYDSIYNIDDDDDDEYFDSHECM